MLPPSILVLCLAAVSARAQSSDSTSTASSGSGSTDSGSSASTSIPASGLVVTTTGAFGTATITEFPLTDASSSVFTGSQYTYLSETSQSSVDTSSGAGSNSSSTASSDSQITVSSQTPTLTQIVGGGGSNSSTSTGTATASSVAATNTQACNNYPEFCSRKYSNITEVCAHNSAFAIQNNAASNQALSITNMLDDGIRMLQGETHYVNNTIYNCHTSCSLLNAGTWQSELEEIAAWVRDHPYDVVTFLIVNSDYVTVENYTAPIQNSGLAPYLYEPSFIPQHRDQWPTLAEMILSQKRVVFFMDYNANQTSVPYILDEFTHMWETPFSPTNQSFPCTQQRPPNLNQTTARDEYMYLANHNLNTDINLSSLGDDTEILIPNTAALNQTNGLYDTLGQLGQMTNSCQADWGRPPNFLLVDYYNMGDPAPGSVFEVAAYHNNVTYNRKCCGIATSAASIIGSPLALVFATIVGTVLLAL